MHDTKLADYYYKNERLLPGDKIVCIDNINNTSYFTIGKVYILNYNGYGDIGYIITDSGYQITLLSSYYDGKRRFRKLSDIRNDKIDKLLDNV